eukprot:6849660-Pyramimonas_sp.AAC.1
MGGYRARCRAGAGIVAPCQVCEAFILRVSPPTLQVLRFRLVAERLVIVYGVGAQRYRTPDPLAEERREIWISFPPARSKV